MTLTAKTKLALREVLPQRLDEELDQMNEEQATDEIMQSVIMGDKLDDYPR